MMKAALVVALVIPALAAQGGCRRKADKAQGPVPAAVTRPATAQPNPVEKARSSERLFGAWCGGCHGERGRGDGPAAKVLVPPPRDFVKEKFKVRSTPSGTMPTRQDLFDTVTRGLPGTAMPAFAFLSEAERWELVDHVAKLADVANKKQGEVVDLGTEPPSDAASIARGKAIYDKLLCGSCHGATGRGDGASSKDLKDEWGRPVPARDYTLGQYLGGDSARAVHTRFRTGLDGTSMPSFAKSISLAEGWDLTHFVLSLRTPPPPAPTDKVELGRRVVQDRRCDACHVIEGKGGEVGPSLDVSATKLRWDWTKAFLADPLKTGKIYYYTAARMPDLKLTPDEIEGVLALLASVAKRPYPEPEPAPAQIDESKVADGQLLYFLKCTECHNMGNVIPTPEAKLQGPDLINVASRIRFEWISTWVNNPKQVYPAARMVDTNLLPDQVTAVTAFVWKTSAAAQKP